MKPITVYTGPVRSDMLMNIRELFSTKSSVLWLSAMVSGRNMLKHKYLFESAHEATDLIIIDDVLEKDLMYFISALNTDKITIRSRRNPDYIIDRPDVIIICTCDGVDLSNIEYATEVFFGSEYIPGIFGKRDIRLKIGESFIDWADNYFSQPNHLQVAISRNELFNDFIDYTKARITSALFTIRLTKYCKYRNLKYNPHIVPGGRDFKNGVDYITITK
jgi:hypothetical protein